MTNMGEMVDVGDTREMEDVETRVTELARWRVLPGWGVLLASAAAFWVVGFLPWIIEGMHLEVSSAWVRFDTLEGPLVALPFTEYSVTTLFISSVIGGCAALAVTRLAAPSVGHPRLLGAAGAALAVVASLAQTLATVRPVMAQTDEARLLVAVLVLTLIGSAVFGMVVGAGVARGRGWLWLLGGAVAASVAGSWLVDMIARDPGGTPDWVLRLAHWHPWVGALLLGGVLAVFGFRPASRGVGWLLALAIAWVVPSLLTAATFVTYYASQGTLTRSHLGEVIDSGRDVFVQSLSPGNHKIWPLAAAVVIGVAGATLIQSRRRPIRLGA